MDKHHVFKFFLGSVLLGFVALLIIKASDYAQSYFEAISHHWKYSSIFLTPIGFVIISGLIKRFFNGAQGSGIPQTMCALKLNPSDDYSPYLSFRILIGKLLIVPAYFFGGSLGFEGPAVQIGASLMVTIQKYINLSKAEVYYGFIMSGAAAGLSASLTAPLTGIMFVLEEFSRYYYNNKVIVLILFAVIVSGIISDNAAGHYSFLSLKAIDVIPFELSSFKEWLFVPLCGLIGGIAGSIFNHSLLYMVKKLSRLTIQYPIYLAAAMGLLVGILNIHTNGHTAGCGAIVAKNIFLQQPVPLIDAPLKMAATLFTYASGVPTGLFTPSLGIGAILSQILVPIVPATMNFHIIIILMMAAYLCGVLQAPLTVCILIMEITGQDSLLLPLIATTIVSNYTANALLKIPLYESLMNLMEKNNLMFLKQYNR